jgi:hypothetical protein
LEFSAEHAWIFAQRGRVRRLMKRYDEALADFDRAIERDPGDEELREERAEILRLTGGSD